MTWIAPVTLSDDRVELIPLSADHAPELRLAVRDGDLWTLWYTSVPDEAGMDAEIARRLRLQEEGTMLPFAVRDKKTGTLVGMTTFMNIEADKQRVEIGSTWYARSVQRTGLNTHCKLLLLEHAFEALDCIAVEFRTNFFNRQSRTAIERLGAKLDGILRAHQKMADGALRDTCVYSIVASEWPAVRTHLRYQISRYPA
ncbi:GNAT family N-acetyltransferase [Sneathiella chinensis]|uniref:GCN5 family N-acetyltransferase n=1 Tax=Sneathiella chinensis TaxID=349750 RepID=A0ABQ5U0M6_9PROT|nr:GNAT family protein [Sneathiella chinensis]GLQ05225.1 GCN5 family N-acetyltransferase [Sneathiella chinensis]